MLPLLLLVVIGADAPPQTTLNLTLPPTVYAVVGEPMSLVFDNLILSQSPEKCRFEIDCDVAGKTFPTHWTVTPTTEQAGRHELTVTVVDPDGESAEAVTTELVVVPATSGDGTPLRLLIVGDSLTHATLYPNELARLLRRPGNPHVTFLGTHRPGNAAEGVAHEGYGGWTWQRFVSHYEPMPDPAARKHSSPFVFPGSDGKPQLNVKQYIDQHCDGTPPDVVLLMLGINDCFGADPESIEAIDKRVTHVFEQAETLLKAFREAAPAAGFGICLTTPPNARESGFEANYKGRYHRWGWKRIQHRLVQRQISHFSGREDESLFILPTELNLDPVAGYPVDNGVHPNQVGYHQIAASMYAWLKWNVEE